MQSFVSISATVLELLRKSRRGQILPPPPAGRGLKMKQEIVYYLVVYKTRLRSTMLLYLNVISHLNKRLN